MSILHDYFIIIFVVLEIVTISLFTVILNSQLLKHPLLIRVAVHFFYIVMFTYFTPTIFMYLSTVIYPDKQVGLEGFYYVVIPVIVAFISYLFASLFTSNKKNDTLHP